MSIHDANKSRGHFMAWLATRLRAIPVKKITTIRKQVWYSHWKRLLANKPEEEAMRWVPIIYSQMDHGRAFRSYTTAAAAERALALAWVDTFPDTIWTPSDLLWSPT